MFGVGDEVDDEVVVVVEERDVDVVIDVEADVMTDVEEAEGDNGDAVAEDGEDDELERELDTDAEDEGGDMSEVVEAAEDDPSVKLGDELSGDEDDRDVEPGGDEPGGDELANVDVAAEVGVDAGVMVGPESEEDAREVDRDDEAAGEELLLDECIDIVVV